MVSAYAQTDLAVGLEASGWREEAERRWPERVGGWQDDAAVVDAFRERGAWGPTECEVPFEEVGVGGWRGVVVG